jgi:hypothetical protein
MDKTALVNLDVERGREITEVLERANSPLTALWAILPEYEDWRLVISAREFDSLHDLGRAYRRLIDTLNSAGIDPDKRPPILILPLTDPFIKQLRRDFGKAKSVEGRRLGGQMIGDRFIDDAYVYRIR